MRTRPAGLLALSLWIGSLVTSCGGPDPIDWSTRDEVPPAQLSAVVSSHYRGLGAMERYEYGDAVAAFREVHQKAPGWVPGSINLAIALLNKGGEADAKLKGT